MKIIRLSHIECFRKYSIVLIIVKKDDNYVVEYCSDDRIIAREYGGNICII